MAERIEDLLRACTVLITGSKADGRKAYGTGFFMAPGQIVTAAHVVQEPDVWVQWKRDDAPDLTFSARKSSILYNPTKLADDGYPDIAILDVEHTDHPCIAVDPEIPQMDDNFVVFAYSRMGTSVELAPERLTYVGIRGTQPTTYLDLASGTVKQGMAGAALLNRRTAGVCGLLVMSKNIGQPLGGLAVPWSAVHTDLAELLAANRAFHDSNGRWVLAAGHQSTAVNAAQDAAKNTAYGSDQPNLLFRVYIPAERLYAAEASKLLSLFREWVTTTDVSGVRQAGYRTASGEMFEFFADAPLSQLDLGERFGDFSDFLTLCAGDPSAAAKTLARRGIGPVLASDLVTRFGREVRRLQVDLRHERERRILTIRHGLEEELLYEGAGLTGMQSGQLNALLESLVPGASAPESLALLTAGADRLAAPITLNINPQIISAAQSTIIQSVQGTVNLGPQAMELLSLIERFGGSNVSSLQSAVYELEDTAAPPAARTNAKVQLARFLRQLPTIAKNVGVEILEKYIEHKMGLST